MIRRIALAALTLVTCAGAARAEDWPQWGRDPSRNMASTEKPLPVEFDPGKLDAEGLKIDVATMKNVRWVARLGSAAYGNPTIAKSRILVGTNNDTPRNAKYKGDYSVLLCLDEATGNLVWQLAVPKLKAGKQSDWEHVGIASSPAIVGDRVYVVTSRCEILCLDLNGLANGNDGAFKDEAQYTAGPGNTPIPQDATDADILWRYDMRDELGVFPHYSAASSVLVVGDRVYATTSNSTDWTKRHVPAPDAPALICLDATTGKLLGREASGISRRTLHSNWSSPSFGKAGDQEMVLFGGGDGWCYAFDPVPVAGPDGTAVLKELWRFDCNPPDYRTKDGKPLKYGPPKGPSEVIATPVIQAGRVYVSIGQDPESEEGDGCLNCIDATKRGDISQSGLVWRFTKMGRSLSTVATDGALIFVADHAGFVYCLDAAKGDLVWKHDLEGNIWGSPLLGDGKVYVGNGSGQMLILEAGREKKVVKAVQFESNLFSTVVTANGRLIVATERWLYSIGK